MKMTAVKSSNINAIGYAKDSQNLHVEFKNGKRFFYKEVTAEEYAKLMAADSVGKHFNQFIKAVKVGLEAEFIADSADKGSVSDEEQGKDEIIAKLEDKANLFAAKVIEQAEKIKLLREALVEISEDKIDVSSRVMGIAICALESIKE